ncbi:hypothetical protein RB653_003523 [Dictyostelium firmibasis]|uniref:Fanconi anemia group I protein homolog n=1 Tax=Dictyostelium firmibasis TaxID=79012 RepID=A0AAN7TZD4_9MYCE
MGSKKNSGNNKKLKRGYDDSENEIDEDEETHLDDEEQEEVDDEESDESEESGESECKEKKERKEKRKEKRKLKKREKRERKEKRKLKKKEKKKRDEKDEDNEDDEDDNDDSNKNNDVIDKDEDRDYGVNNNKDNEDETNPIQNEKNSEKKKDKQPKIIAYDNPYRDKKYNDKRFDEFIIEESKKRIPINNNTNNSSQNDDNENVEDEDVDNDDDSMFSSQKKKQKNNNITTSKLDIDNLYLIFLSMQDDGNEIVKFLPKRIYERKEIFEYIQVVMKSLMSEKDPKEQKEVRGKMFEKFLNEFIIYDNLVSIDEKQLEQCMDFLLTECDGLSRHTYREIATLIADNISTIRKPPILQLIPRVFEQLSYQTDGKSIVEQEADESFKSKIIDTICQQKWDPLVFSLIVSMFNDISLTKAHLDLIVAKIFRDGRELHLDEYPALMNNVVLLSRQGLKGKILLGICEFFGELDQRYPPDHQGTQDNGLSYIESFVLVQLTLSIRSDPEIAKEYLKLNQNPSHFVIGLLMSMSKIPRHKVAAIDSLKSLSNQVVRKDIDTIEQLLLGAVSKNWENIIDPFVNFAISLMDSNGLVITEQIKSLRVVGGKILFELYVRHPTIRDKIMDEIIGRIVMKSNQISQNWFNLLGRIAEEQQFTIRKYLSKLKELFDYLQYYNASTVKQLIGALKPLLLSDGASFLNNVIIVLKKSMFAREVEARASAVTGFIELLKCVSEILLSVNNRGNEHLEKLRMFKIEVFSNLRRALTQQCEIRSILYQGFIDLIGFEKGNGMEFADDIFELLNIQSLHYLELTGNSNSPINIDECLEIKQNQVCLVEPIDRLIYCIQYCLNSVLTKEIEKLIDQFSRDEAKQNPQPSTQQQKQSSLFPNSQTKKPTILTAQQRINVNSKVLDSLKHIKKSSSRIDLEKTFLKFEALMNECRLESFELRKIGVSNTKAVAASQLLIGVLEALIENSSLQFQPSLGRILALFSLYSDIKNFQYENQAAIKSSNTTTNTSKSKKSKKSAANDADDGNNDNNDENDNAGSDENDENDENDSGNNKKSKSKKKNSKSSSSSNTNVTSNEFPSQKCTQTILKLVHSSNEFNRNNLQHKNFLTYIYTTLFNLLTKLSNSTKNLKKTTDLDSQNKSLRIVIEFFRDILPFIYQEFSYQEWVTPPKQEKKTETKKVLVHSLALSCFLIIGQFVNENGSEANLHYVFNNTIDEIKKREFEKAVLLYKRDLEHYQKQQLQRIAKRSRKVKNNIGNNSDDDFADDDGDQIMENVGEDDEEELIEPVEPTRESFKPERGPKVIQSISICIETIIVQHLFPEYYSDLECLFNILSILYSHVQEVQTCFLFLKKISSKHAIESPTLANIILKSIIDMCNSKNSPITETLAKYVLASLGSYKNQQQPVDAYNNPIPPKVLAIINSKTVATTINLLIANEESVIDRSKERISQFKKDWNSIGKSMSSNFSTTDKIALDAFSDRNKLATTLFATCQVLNHLAITKIAGSPHEKFLKLIKKLYSVLTTFINFLIQTTTGATTPEIEDLINQSSLLYSYVVDFIEWTNNSLEKDSSANAVNKKLSKPDLQRMSRESKLLPTITFTLTKYETTVIKYQKKLSGRLVLGKHFKEIKFREFFIDTDKLTGIITNDDDDDENNNAGRTSSRKGPSKRAPKKSSAGNKRKLRNDDDEGDEHDNENTSPKKKRSVNINTSRKYYPKKK